ncbi:ASCH domain-containing protein [Streptomyces avermitilis]|uniref:hypothetical protein n=1 Tax=Streptomyces avermitilis TaxID=33903 RepID=UPI00368CDDA0
MSTGTLPQAGDWIRGISVKQPWTTAIAAGAKTIENRPQHWSWRGWLLLHAGLQIDRPALRLPLVARTIRGRDLPTGAVVGVARLTGCHQDPDGAAGSSGYQKLRKEVPYYRPMSVVAGCVHESGSLDVIFRSRVHGCRKSSAHGLLKVDVDLRSRLHECWCYGLDHGLGAGTFAS